MRYASKMRQIASKNTKHETDPGNHDHKQF